MIRSRLSPLPHPLPPPGGARSALLFALALAVLGALPAAGDTIGFEDLGANLPLAHPDTGDPEHFYSGYTAFAAGEESDFSSGLARFANDFEDFGGGCCSRGWFYSQTTDTTTPGFGNQYSAIPGAGVGGSATYGVAFTGGVVGAQAEVARIVFSQEVALVGAHFTNTTYAALAMLNGDGFAKQFGGASGDDPDFFTLQITGRDAGGLATGSLELVLADYRFADNSLDYLVSDWIWQDLAGLGSVASLDFELESSDQAFGFLNTPSYFAMDGLVFTPEPATGALLGLGLAGLAARRRRR